MVHTHKNFPPGDPREVLNLLENCPPEFAIGPEVGKGLGKGIVFPYRNYEFDFRAVYRGVAEQAAKDPAFKHLSLAGAPKADAGEEPPKKKKKKTDEAEAS